MAEEERKNYEQRAEVITKRLMSKLYALESNALEAKMSTRENIDKLDKELEDIASQKKELEKKYYDLVHSSDSQWRNLSNDFEELVRRINVEKQDFYEKAQSWLNDFNRKISDLEERARNSSQEVRESTHQQLEYLRNQRERLQNSLVDMRKESGEQWQGIRSKIDEGLHTMTTNINRLYQNFQQRRQDYSTQKFYENAQGWLNDFNEKIADLESKTENSTQEVKSTVNEHLEYIKEQRDKIRQYLEDMNKETGERWKSFRSDIEERINNVRSNISKAYQSFPGRRQDASQQETSGEDDKSEK